MNDPTAAVINDTPGVNIATSKTAGTPWSAHLAKIPKMLEEYGWLREKMTNRKKQIRRWNSRFLHDESVFDERTEKQRSTQPFMLDPHVYTNIMAMVTHLVDQFMASSPQLKVRGRGYEDQGDAAIERLLQYDLTESNPAAEWVGSTFRRAAIGGLAINRMRYVEEYDTITPRPGETDSAADADYRASVEEATKSVGPPPSHADPDTHVAQYSQWEQAVRAKTGRPVARTPVTAPERIARRIGTIIDPVPLDDFEWDPSIATIEDQPCVWTCTYPRRDVLLAMADAAPDVWDRAAIESLPREGTKDIKSGSEIKKAQMAALDVKDDGGCNPFYDDVICLKERWAPRESIFRYVPIGNDNKPLTKDPNFYPFNVSRSPFFGFFNVPTDGASVGISEYQPNGLMNDWLDKLQSMQLYWMALRIFTPMAVASGSNLKQILEDNCVPGGIVEVDDFDDIRPLFEKFGQEAGIAENALQVMRSSLDRATGINETTRGEQATLNRVTGAEFLGRQGSMQVRMKDRLYRFGTTLGNMARFDCALRYQFGARDHLKNIAGLDPFMGYNRNVLLPAISSDYIFTPASASAEGGLQAQQIGELAKFLGTVGGLVPGGGGMMQLVARYLQAMRIPGADELAKALQGDAKLGQQMQQLQGQVKQLTESSKLIQAQNDALRAKLPVPVPPAQELDAEMKALAPAEGEQPAEGQPGQPPQGQPAPPAGVAA